ncbi:hypothetical protein EUX98_g4787 [Antrodiella citrinella]|uniref:NmrA-like domain-containing protein n=1 Tax=Antrodiella citrinella TaxID=2447956 RepID=A0A4S4MT85_9APHY|nr:hypothetical protein EUX98_g4787 [Antrodiella citrinella]
MSSGPYGEPKILVVGATGKQGHAVIRALTRGRGEPPAFPVHVLALTRNPSSPKALALAKDRPWLELVKGNLDSRDSMRQVFIHAGGRGAVWGVFMVLPYAGLGESTEGEAVQGITLADLAMQFAVSIFVYSSVHRGETDDDSDRSLPEHAGKIATTVLRAGLKKDVKIRMVAVDDIGLLVATLFQRPVNIAYKVMVVAGDDLTATEQDDVFRRVTGKPAPSFPHFLGSFILAINSGLRDITYYLDFIFRYRADNSELFEEHISNTHAVVPAAHMTSFEEWVKQYERRKRKKQTEGGGSWNRISLSKLLMGRL